MLMNRREYMNRLESCLTCIEKSERDAALRYYEEYFDDAGPEREAEVIASLGTPEALAREIIGAAGEGKSARATNTAENIGGEFNSIKANLMNANFILTLGSGYAVDISYPQGAETPDVSIKNGVLYINEKRRQYIWNIFTRDAWKQGRVEVTVPDAKLSDINIENVNGKIYIPAINADRFHGETVNGGVTLEGTQGGNIHCESVNGAVSMTNCTARDGAHGETVNGSVTIAGELRGKIHAEAVNGSVSVATALPVSQYDIDVETVSGSVRVDGEKYKKSYHSRRGMENSIKAESVNGSVTVEFGV